MSSKEAAQLALNELAATTRDIAISNGSDDSLRRLKIEEMMWKTYQQILDSDLCTTEELDYYKQVFETQKLQKEFLEQLVDSLKVCSDKFKADNNIAIEDARESTIGGIKLIPDEKKTLH
jgi:hypothetical protein